MATLEERLRSAFIGDAGVAGFIGDRLYDPPVPQNLGPLLPCAAQQRISTVPLYQQERGDISVGWARFQITIWAGGPDGRNIADQTADAFEAALETFNLWSLPASPLVVNATPNFLLNRRSGVKPETRQPLAQVILDIKVWFSRQ